jgi:hypothetical protein
MGDLKVSSSSFTALLRFGWAIYKLSAALVMDRVRSISKASLKYSVFIDTPITEVFHEIIPFGYFTALKRARSPLKISEKNRLIKYRFGMEVFRK